MTLKHFLKTISLATYMLTFSISFPIQAAGSPAVKVLDVKEKKEFNHIKGVKIENFAGKVIVDSSGARDAVDVSLEGDAQFLNKITVESKHNGEEKILFIAYEKGAPIVQDINKVVLTLKMAPQMPLDLSLVGGKGDIGPRATNDTKINITGYGDVKVASTQNLTGNIEGSGEITINKIKGDADLFIGGDGTFLINEGTITNLKASIKGTGIITIKGDVENADLSSDGAGTINLVKVKNTLKQSTSGAGKINITGTK
ncbi:MAG: hypothetical protein FJX71_00525 [Alphaproteobacteria bacterium]|nr:hypothetical protein [Alphaproteobacteria bacterium]